MRIPATCLSTWLAAAVLLLGSVALRAQPGAGVPEADPQLLGKLAAGQTQGLDFSEAGRRDMLAVVKAFIDADCSYRQRPGDPPGAADFASLMGQLMPTSLEATLVLPFLVAHPAYLRTATLVGVQGCDSAAAQGVLRTLLRALRAAPARQPAAPTPQRPRFEPQEPSSAQHTLNSQRINPWWKATGAFNPGGRFEQILAETRVLSCDYRSQSAPHPEGRYAWFDAPPAALAELRRLGRGHPVAEIGPLRLDNCPKALSDFDQAKRDADRGSR